MPSNSVAKKRTLSLSPSALEPNAKRNREAEPTIEYEVKSKKDPEFEWITNLYVTAYVVQSDIPGSAEVVLSPDDTGKVTGGEGTSSDDESVGDDFSDESEAMSGCESESEQEIPNSIGSVVARIIFRERIRRHFWREMEEPSQDTSQLAFELFDRCVVPYPDLQRSPTVAEGSIRMLTTVYSYGFLRKEYITGRSKGSGVWGAEVSFGRILHIEEVSVKPLWRRQGIGLTMLKKAIDKAREIKWVSVALAWPSYLSWSIPDTLPEDEQKKMRKHDYETSVALFRKAGFRSVGSSVWLCLSFDPNHPSHKITPDQDYDSPDGPNERTELEKLEDALEAWRTKRGDRWLCVDMSDNFRGFPDGDVKNLLQLQGLTGPIEPLVLARAKYGCDCGGCIGGFLSPRMHYTLLAQAEIHHDMTSDELDYLDFTEDDCMEWSMLGSLNQHVPSHVKSNMRTNKSMRQGFTNVFNHIATCLKAKRLPTVPNVLCAVEQASEWPPHVRNYLQRGGTIGAVLLGLRDISMDQDYKTGDGSLYDCFKDDIDKLAECRNDHEFGFVLGMLLEDQAKDPK